MKYDSAATTRLRRYLRPSDHRLLGVTAMLVAVLSCGGCQTLHHDRNKEDAQRRWSAVRGRFKYQLAKQQYDSGLFHDAVMTATEAISLDPKEVSAYVVLARSNLELGKLATAEVALRAASELGLGSAAITYTDGVIREQRNDLPGALAKYRAARLQDPTSVAYLIAEAECLVALDRSDEAIHLLDEQGGAYDDRASVATLAAHISALQGQSDEAIERYRDALGEQSTSPTIRRELGLLLARRQRCDEAITVLKPLIDSADAPDGSGLIRRTLAGCYLELGAARAARDVLAYYADGESDDALAQLLLAKAALALNDLMTATQALDRAQQTAPNRPELWLVRATIQWRRGAFADAAATLYDLLASQPDDVDAMCLLAEVLKSTRRSDGAKGYYERALAVDPDCVWARAGLASLNQAQPAPGVIVQPRFSAAQ